MENTWMHCFPHPVPQPQCMHPALHVESSHDPKTGDPMHSETLPFTFLLLVKEISVGVGSTPHFPKLQTGTNVSIMLFNAVTLVGLVGLNGRILNYNTLAFAFCSRCEAHLNPSTAIPSTCMSSPRSLASSQVLHSHHMAAQTHVVKWEASTNCPPPRGELPHIHPPPPRIPPL